MLIVFQGALMHLLAPRSHFWAREATQANTHVQPRMSQYRIVNESLLCSCRHHDSDPLAPPRAFAFPDPSNMPNICLECWVAAFIECPSACAFAATNSTPPSPVQPPVYQDPPELYAVDFDNLISATMDRISDGLTPWRSKRGFFDFICMLDLEFLPMFWTLCDCIDENRDWGFIGVSLEGLLGLTGGARDEGSESRWQTKLILHFPGPVDQEISEKLHELCRVAFPKRLRRQIKMCFGFGAGVARGLVEASESSREINPRSEDAEE
jgi:hypothetical protein